MPNSYEEAHTHCWHESQTFQYVSFPPQWEERCCWCGAKRLARQEYVTPEGHGPHAPKVPVTRYNDRLREGENG